MGTRKMPAVVAAAAEPRELITLAEASRRCGVSDRTFRRYISDGYKNARGQIVRVNATRVGPRLLMVDVKELEKLYQPAGSAAQ